MRRIDAVTRRHKFAALLVLLLVALAIQSFDVQRDGEGAFSDAFRTMRAPATTLSLLGALFGLFYTAVVVSQLVGMAQSARGETP
jgi:hypothetical protein